VTLLVSMEKSAVRCPAGIVTVAGTVADGSSLSRSNTIPPAGAGPLRMTVPFTLVPPNVLGGEILSRGIGGSNVSCADTS